MPKRKNFAAIKVINKRRKARAEANIATDASGEANLPEGASDFSTDEPMEQNDGASGSNNDASTSSSVQPTAGGNSPGGSNSSSGAIRGEAILPKGLPILGATYTRVFSKQWKLRIFNRYINRRTHDTDNALYNVFIPSYDELPIGHLGFYLYPEEFRRLQQATRVVVKDVQGKVSNDTAIQTFETNASTTNIGNNNVGVKVAIINPMISQYRSGKYASDQRNVIANVFHGTNPSAFPVSITNTTNFAGGSAEIIQRNYVNPFEYYTVRTAKQVAPVNNTFTVNQGFFPVDRFIEEQYNASMNEGQFATFQFTPQSGLIVSNNAFIEGTAIPDSITVMNRNTRNMMTQLTRSTTTSGTNKRGMPGTANNANNSELQSLLPQNFRNYASIYDVCVDPFSSGGVGFERFPACAFGFKPLTSINNSDAVPAVTPMHLDITVDAWISLEISEGGMMVDNSRVPRLVEHDAYEAPQQLQEWTGSGTFAAEDHHSSVTLAKAQKHFIGITQLPLNANPAMDDAFEINKDYETHTKKEKKLREEREQEIKDLAAKIKATNSAARLGEYTLKYLDLTKSHKRHTRSVVKQVASNLQNNLPIAHQSMSDDDMFL